MKHNTLLAVRSAFFAVVLAMVFASVVSRAQTSGVHWIEKSIDVEVQEKNPNVARKLLLESATQKISEEMVKSIIGESKYTRNMSLIQNKVIKVSSRYVPVAKPGDLLPIDEGFKMNVVLKINQDDLQALLLENGLFYDSDSTPLILPLVQITNKVSGNSYQWWTASSSEAAAGPVNLPRVGRDLEGRLRSAFWKSNFYLERPQTYHFSELVATQDKARLAAQFNAPIFVDGEVLIASGKRSEQTILTVRLVAIQTQNLRSIAEVVREYEVDSTKLDYSVGQKLKENLEVVAGDLSQQVLEAWQKGSIGANLFRLAIVGRVPIQKREQFKDGLRSYMKEVKSVHERLVSGDEYVLEVDSALTAKEFLQKLPKITIGSFVLNGIGANEREVRYSLVAEKSSHEK